ncbi:MAG TPA: hypothetical protein VNJ08_01555 [Bacteriovoracaceae bacterium]|nr:hypothetical protein [Bacteriovoracaceae bacterium]
MSIKIVLLLLVTVSCSQMKKLETPHKAHAPKEFSRGELIMGTQLISRVFDGEMAPLSCIPTTDEASLLLRTIQPRMDIVQDDIESLLDDNKEVEELIKNCDQSCTCPFIDDLLREHLVILTKPQQKMLEKKRSQKEVNRCLTYMQETFCKSELYQELNKEKVDFSFEE